ncbi:12400_t:CDS:2 [Funneliformis caledonium]|uniref:12400_t:CDS:1 n=1 Tax=Funneliformis caledonium TaxID=1117310 RepID=A0A9N8YUY4_9GLOM|nr:12400_t:CDS:2 [Funneliformis caledonium]
MSDLTTPIHVLDDLPRLSTTLHMPMSPGWSANASLCVCLLLFEVAGSGFANDLRIILLFNLEIKLKRDLDIYWQF